MSVIASLPGFVQAAMGGTTGTAGLVLGFMVIVWTFGSIGSGWLMVHITYRITSYAGACGIIVGALLLAMLTPQSSVADAVLGVSILGVGLGFCNTTWIVCVQTGVSDHERGAATSAVMFMRFLGQALGAAMGGIILSFSLRRSLPGVSDPLGRLLDRQIAVAITERADLAQAASYAFHGVFLLTACMGLAALTLNLAPASGPQREYIASDHCVTWSAKGDSAGFGHCSDPLAIGNQNIGQDLQRMLTQSRRGDRVSKWRVVQLER